MVTVWSGSLLLCRRPASPPRGHRGNVAMFGAMKLALASQSILCMTSGIADPADSLRAALERAGFNARKVSVRWHHSTLCCRVRRC